MRSLSIFATLLLIMMLLSSFSAQSQSAEDACSNKKCQCGARCSVSESLAACACRTDCPDNHEPVCGSDDMTYINQCHLEVAACEQRTVIRVRSTGACPDVCRYKICTCGAQCEIHDGKAVCACPPGCYDFYKPLCGSDGKTYRNECSKKIAECQQRAVIDVAHDGTCETNDKE